MAPSEFCPSDPSHKNITSFNCSVGRPGNSPPSPSGGEKFGFTGFGVTFKRDQSPKTIDMGIGRWNTWLLVERKGF